MATSNSDYAGDIDCREAWALLREHSQAQLIDVRTVAEWTFVGLPDLASVGRRTLTVEWQSYPSMTLNSDFVAEISELLARQSVEPDTPLLFLCRSGVRSRAAAIAMTQAGFTKAYNVAGGFEGDRDEEDHRGTCNGWKADGLPWRQS